MARGNDRRPPRTGPTERDVLVGFLDYLRESVIGKLDDVPEPQIRTAMVPSGTNLLGLVKHLESVERFIFLGERATSWPETFTALDDEPAASLVARYRRTIADVNAHLDRFDDLSEQVHSSGEDGSGPSARWALTHMIEETGRHAGHADIIRELIDGATGR